MRVHYDDYGCPNDFCWVLALYRISDCLQEHSFLWIQICVAEVFYIFFYPVWACLCSSLLSMFFSSVFSEYGESISVFEHIGHTGDSWLLFTPSQQLWGWRRAVHIFRQWRGGDQTIWDFRVPVPEFPFSDIWERKADRIGTETKIQPFVVDTRRRWHRSICLRRYSLPDTLSLDQGWPMVWAHPSYSASTLCIWESRKEKKMRQDAAHGAKGLLSTSQGDCHAGGLREGMDQNWVGLDTRLWDPFLSYWPLLPKFRIVFIELSESCSLLINTKISCTCPLTLRVCAISPI